MLWSSVSAKEGVLFDVKSFCRLPIEEAKAKLPVSIDFFQVTKREVPVYGHEETWILSDKTKLKLLELKTIQIEIHQNRVQSIWFVDIGAEKNKAAILSKNLTRSGLQASELTKVMSEYRVNSDKGYPIRILGESQDNYQCFEYHAGHYLFSKTRVRSQLFLIY